MEFISNFLLVHCAHSIDIYKVEHEKRIPYLQAAIHYFAYYINIVMATFFCIDDFSKISENFPKISENSPKLVRRPDKRFRKFTNIVDDFRR